MGKAVSEQDGVFIGFSGKLYIRVRRVVNQQGNTYTDRTAVYSSIDAYNLRSERPDYIDIGEARKDFDKLVTIDPETLQLY